MNGMLLLDTVYDSRKSFYGKATIEMTKDRVTLYSYGRAIIESDGNNVKALWDGWSMTTGRHINEFFLQFYGTPCNKRLFEKIQNGEIETIEELRNEWRS